MKHFIKVIFIGSLFVSIPPALLFMLLITIGEIIPSETILETIHFPLVIVSHLVFVVKNLWKRPIVHYHTRSSPPSDFSEFLILLASNDSGTPKSKNRASSSALFSLVGATSPNPFDRKFFSGCALFQRFIHIYRSLHFQKLAFLSLRHLHYFSLFPDQACRKTRHPLSANFTLSYGGSCRW